MLLSDFDERLDFFKKSKIMMSSCHINSSNIDKIKNKLHKLEVCNEKIAAIINIGKEVVYLKLIRINEFPWDIRNFITKNEQIIFL